MQQGKKIILRVNKSPSTPQKVLTIPRRETEIQKGDFVVIQKINLEEEKNE